MHPFYIFLPLIVFISTFGLWMIIMIPFLVAQSGVNKGIRKAKGTRFSQFVPFSGDPQAFGAYLHGYLESVGYHCQNYGPDEFAYRKGGGFFAAAKFLKFSFVPGGILVEAFLVVYGYWETGIYGFFGWLPKSNLRAATFQLIGLIQSAAWAAPPDPQTPGNPPLADPTQETSPQDQQAEPPPAP